MMEIITFISLCLWLNYSDKSAHGDRIPVGVKNIRRLLCMASESLESEWLYENE